MAQRSPDAHADWGGNVMGAKCEYGFLGLLVGPGMSVSCFKNWYWYGVCARSAYWEIAGDPITDHGRLTMKRWTVLVALCSSNRVKAWVYPSLSRGMSRIIFHMTATNNNKSILQQDNGNINRELAERIWNWEQEHRKNQALPKLEYSVRSGLRLVDSTAQSVLLQLPANRRTSLYSDLVQEGLNALLDALSHYRRADSEGFESYARNHIRKQLIQTLDQDTAVVRLPRRVKALLQHAKAVAKDWRKQTGKNPTIAQLASKMNVPTERLQDYLQLAKRETISVESTVEISHPMLEDSMPAYRDQDVWELRQGLLLDNGHVVKRETLVEDYLDEMMSREGDDDSWIQEQEQVAGRLQDMIPDDSPSPDDEALAEMIRNNLSNFLTTTLEPNELRIIRMTFGMGEAKPMSRKKMAEVLSITPEAVSKLLSGALIKLRKAYTSRYVEPYLDDDHVIDSV